MSKPARTLPSFTDAARLLKSVVCGRCGGLRLPKQKCMDCIARIEAHRRYPQLLQGNNWALRTPESKKRFYLCRKKRNLHTQLAKVEFKIDSMLTKKNMRSLLDKRKRIVDKLKVITQELEAMSKPAREKSKDKTEIVLQCLQSISAQAKQSAEDELRYVAAGII